MKKIEWPAEIIQALTARYHNGDRVKDITAWLKNSKGFNVSESTVSVKLKALGLSRERIPPTPSHTPLFDAFPGLKEGKKIPLEKVFPKGWEKKGLAPEAIDLLYQLWHRYGAKEAPQQFNPPAKDYIVFEQFREYKNEFLQRQQQEFPEGRGEVKVTLPQLNCLEKKPNEKQ